MNDYRRILFSTSGIKAVGALIIFSYFAYIDWQTFNANKAFWRAGEPDWITLLLTGLIPLLALGAAAQ